MEAAGASPHGGGAISNTRSPTRRIRAAAASPCASAFSPGPGRPSVDDPHLAGDETDKASGQPKQCGSQPLGRSQSVVDGQQADHLRPGPRQRTRNPVRSQGKTFPARARPPVPNVVGRTESSLGALEDSDLPSPPLAGGPSRFPRPWLGRVPLALPRRGRAARAATGSSTGCRARSSAGAKHALDVDEAAVVAHHAEQLRLPELDVLLVADRDDQRRRGP